MADATERFLLYAGRETPLGRCTADGFEFEDRARRDPGWWFSALGYPFWESGFSVRF